MQELPSSLVNVMATADIPSIGLASRVKWIFPVGLLLNIGGVVLNAVLEQPRFDNAQGWEFLVLSRVFLPMLLVGSAFMMIGAFLDRQRLPARQARLRGVLCWAISTAAFSLLTSLHNVHGWAFAFLFPAFAGLIAGIIFLP